VKERDKLVTDNAICETFTIVTDRFCAEVHPKRHDANSFPSNRPSGTGWTQVPRRDQYSPAA
jgi:hypothetical protein